MTLGLHLIAVWWLSLALLVALLERAGAAREGE
jgi:hypothetical protein